MNIATKLLEFDCGDAGLESTVEELESDGQAIVAVTGRVGVKGHPLGRLVGPAPVLLAMLQDGWGLSLDEAASMLEQ